MAERVIPLVDQRLTALAAGVPDAADRRHRLAVGHAGPAAARPAHLRHRPLQLPLQLLHAQGSLRQGLPFPAACSAAQLRGDHAPGAQFVAHGVRKLRLTGGEPLLRKNLES